MPGFLNFFLYGRLYVCVSALRLLITSGVMWCDMVPIRLVKQVLQLLYDNYSNHKWAWPWNWYVS